ncbi:MAG: PD-(D/E)XK nuclease family protein [Candidatus Omnitrophota bacterium]
MDRVITYSFGENFIANLANFISDNFLKTDNDLSRIACVFGGRRPALFLQRELSGKIKRAYIPPSFFSMDEFIDYLISSQSLKKISDLDACFLIYTLAKKHIPMLLEGRESFSAFLPWAREIVSFIEQIDLEDIDSQSLLSVEKSASIGYEIPKSINNLLTQITALRSAYHKALSQKGLCSRGLRYAQAAKFVAKKRVEEYEAILFCNFFYLHTVEQKIVKEIYQQGRGICIFQGSEDKWSVLKANAKELAVSIKPKGKAALPNFSLYQGFDLHSQISIVREVLGRIKNKDNTLIVLPQAQALIPLLTEVTSLLDELNVSLGYPLKQSSLYVLFDLMLKAQGSRAKQTYYTKDYLNLMRHPLVKNLSLGSDSAITRVMVHKIEELLQGQEETSIGGSLFLSLNEIEAEEKIYLRSHQVLANMDISVSSEDCKVLLVKLHQIFFEHWQEIRNFKQFSDRFLELLKVLVENSKLVHFPFNRKVVEQLYKVGEELESLSFAQEKFSSDEIWEIFQQILQAKLVPFLGSPLKGTQILGLLEARSLSFENVIIIDLNESILPKLKIYEPLIPREVMLNLGLNRLEKEEEIQRYQFMRLISSAKNVHLIYEVNQEKEKSRFVEELLWARQSQTKKLEVTVVPKAQFSVAIVSASPKIKKTKDMVRFLEKATYSASRLNTYLNCPLRFYYQYLLGLREKEDLLQDPQAPHIGTFIHELLADTFKVFIAKKPVIDQRFRANFFQRMENSFQKLSRRMKSDSFLLKRIIADRMNKFLNSEAERKVAKIISLESSCKGVWKLGNKTIRFQYTADRIDQLDDKSIVVIDYKTGSTNIVPKRLSALSSMEMNRSSIKDNLKSFQLPLYYYFTAKEFPNALVNAEVYNLRTSERKTFISPEDLAQKEKVNYLSLQALAAILRELFDPSLPFVPDKEERRCQFCPFGSLCR